MNIKGLRRQFSDWGRGARPVDDGRITEPGMLARARSEGRRAGLIIVSSGAAFTPLPYFATYAASKAFDFVLAESLAEELRGEPVDVLALAAISSGSRERQAQGRTVASCRRSEASVANGKLDQRGCT